MKIEIKKVVEVDARYLHVEAGVRYWEDSTLNGVEDINGVMPCRVGELWKPIIDIDNGIIVNWDEEIKADIHYKVCDAGMYTLCDELSNKIITKEGYVPDILSPGGSGYGDYIIMSINENGSIDDWRIILSDFLCEEEE